MTISGQLIDSYTGEPLYGAHIYLVRNGNMLPFQDITDMDGKFSNLGGFEMGDKIAFSYIGYGTQQFDYRQKLFDMIPKNEEIDEITILGTKPAPVNEDDYRKYAFASILSAVFILIAIILVYKYTNRAAWKYIVGVLLGSGIGYGIGQGMNDLVLKDKKA